MTRLRVRVTPRAGRDCIDGVQDGVLRVRLAAPPVEGKANEALMRLLARTLGVAPRQVEIVSGTKGRDKLVEVQGLDQEEVWRRIEASS